MTLKNPDAEFSRFFGNGVALHCMCNSYVKEEKLMIVPLDLEHHKHCPDEITKRAIDWETCNVSLADGIEQLENVAREIDRGILNLKLLEQKIKLFLSFLQYIEVLSRTSLYLVSITWKRRRINLTTL